MSIQEPPTRQEAPPQLGGFIDIGGGQWVRAAAIIAVGLIPDPPQGLRSRVHVGTTWFLSASTADELLAQIDQCERTLLGGDALLPDECRQKRCDYYRGYLAYGPAELTHEGYHAAEDGYVRHSAECRRSERGEVCQVCTGYEKRLRA